MEMGKRDGPELQNHKSWVQEASNKTIQPRAEPIYTDMQEHQQSEDYPPGFAPKSRADPDWSCSSTDQTKMDAGFSNFGDLFSGGNHTLWPGKAVPNPAVTTKGPFSSLLALADAAVTRRSHKDFKFASNGSFACISDSFLGHNWLPPYQQNPSSFNSGYELSRFFRPDHSQQNPYGLPHLPAQGCDLNLHPITQPEAVPGEAIPQFAPITPDKTLGGQSSMLYITHYLGGKDQISQERCSDAARQLILDGQSYAAEIFKTVNEAESDQIVSMSKTPQQKPKRKKHRPKVVSEKKPTPKPTPKSVGTDGETRVKRKYVRRKGIEKSHPNLPSEVTDDSGRQNIDDPPKKSCRKALNFDSKQQTSETIAGKAATAAEQVHDIQNQREHGNDQLPRGFEVELGNGPQCTAHTPNQSMNVRGISDVLFQERQDLSKTSPAQTSSQQKNLSARSAVSVPGTDQQCTDDAPNHVVIQIMTGQNKFFETEGVLPTEMKSRPSDTREKTPNRYMNMSGIQFNSLQAYESNSWLHFPNIHKKKRTEKGQVSISAKPSPMNGKMMKGLGTGNTFNDEKTHILSLKVDQAAKLHENGTSQEEQQVADCFLPFPQTKRPSKKRSRGLTRVQVSTSLNKQMEDLIMPTHTSQKSATDDAAQYQSMQALLMEMDANLSRKKRTKRAPLVNSAYQGALTSEPNGNEPMHQNHHGTLAHKPGLQPEIFWENSVDAIVELLEHLDINKEINISVYQEQNALIPYGIGNEDCQNTLVLYKGDGTIVPFKGSPGVTRRKPRPKVDLDEETDRVWRLLLEDINSQGIDGTDEEKARWWEEERRVFRGRTDSFIARMHLVQGDRRFSPWKGSVVDSVVGVFLTQNVSDHLSSSAFMSLAAQFPANSRQNHCFEEGTSSVINEPGTCILDLEHTSKWSGKMPSPTICDHNSMTPRESDNIDEVEVVNSEESFTCTTGRIKSPNESIYHFLNPNSSRNTIEISYHSVTNRSTTGSIASICTNAAQRAEFDVFSSHESAASSQNNILKAGGDERKVSMSNNSETDDLTNRSRLLKTSLPNGPTSFTQLLHATGLKFLDEVYTHETEDMPSHQNSGDALIESIDADQAAERQRIITSIPTKPTTLEGECSKEVKEGKTSESYKVDSVNNTCRVTSINHDIIGGKMSSTMTKRQVECPENVANAQSPREDNRKRDGICMPEGSCQDEQNGYSLNHSRGSNQLSAERSLTEQVYAASKELDEMNKRASKSKARATGKGKKAEFDWDSLRKQAESNGGKRSRSQNTMDSVDWEAVRCTDVNEIAQTIKDRGMNNVLAERIQDFLNRLVREHGSTDLEWLRDVPPDRAKEYLLSFRGLGLKSVECVRLLTLHHLAFPVDTNVGRIAVRLGWVPLQPLPESLQLHLLELYPVLESIQKYLWPRLCKLDQRTLYELHYQMITFGKVFCTKSRPNCNACPMRGECRHFASAFASVRLALPGPEQRSIVGSSETGLSTQNHPELLQLPSSLTAEQSDEQQLASHGANNCQPIVEEPASPEQENTLIAENDREEADIEDSDQIPTIELNIKEFSQNLQNYMQQNMELQGGDMSKALVALTPEAASIPAPKLKNVNRLRTEHLVYEIPDAHPLLNGLDKLEPDDPCRYLLAIWTPGETANSIVPPEQSCNSMENGTPCDDHECFSCHCIREANSQTVRGTILIPCRTAMRGSFPLNGTYFQVNEVFADHESSLQPIDVPRDWLWKLPRRTVYFGTSIPAIFKGLSTEGIQHCFWRGYVCVRGFDRKTRAPRPLMARLHFPASKLSRTKGKTDGEE
ncbi:hypothetical protein SAY87_009003 [Trapa incisa]|uniref:HhH-GPD domain-containing protein n=1 Tax=Trapa incisa TaxID=236973 RepID=A0AAN7JWG3_9MYRT|nr:hypothetical protein SAY87_009003 [Trapa incisa]